MPHPVKSVFFNDGTHKNLFAIITKTLENGNVNLSYQDPDTGAGQIATDIPEGEGGRTWHD